MFAGFPHILSATQFSADWLETVLFPHVQRLKAQGLDKVEQSLVGKTMATFFYAPSSRTHSFFRAAMKHLGGEVSFTIELPILREEPVEYVIDLAIAYRAADVILLRRDEEGIAARIAKRAGTAVINGGDGNNEHPTQALLDAFTLKEALGEINGISIALSGDLARGREAHSLLYLLSKFSGVRVYLVSSSSLRMPRDILAYAIERSVQVSEYADLRTVASEVQVIYQTRIQKERALPGNDPEEGESFCRIDETVLERLGRDAIIMHPLPRNEEIPMWVDADPRAVYFQQQLKNDLFVRMALLQEILG
ncbi:MAG: aspartate carbamoyltransferase [Patescibacteria group bacterium]